MNIYDNIYIIVGVSILSCYALFKDNEDEVEYEEPQKPEPKKYLKVKRNGKWVDEEIKK